MIGTKTQAYSQILEAAFQLQNGVVVSLDPSSGSRSSMPGYAVYYQGMLLESGILELDHTQPLHSRLQRLAYLIRKLYSAYEPDVMVYEDIPAQRYGGHATYHSSLLKAVGVCMSISGPACVVGITPTSWKKLARSGYVKSDENDALELGWVAIEESKRIAEAEGRRIKKIKAKKKD